MDKNKMLGSNPQQTSKSLISSANLGYNALNTKESNYQNFVHCTKCNKSSILDTVNTGFGSENKVVIECEKPKYKTHLFRENYLSEFVTPLEKKKARDNLDVYSKEEVSNMVSHIIVGEITNLVTKEVLQQELDNLDFTDSEHKSYVNYEIPKNLFK